MDQPQLERLTRLMKMLTANNYRILEEAIVNDFHTVSAQKESKQEKLT